MPQSDDAKDRLTDRDWDMWAAYLKGTTQREIAEKHGVSQSAVSLRLKAVRESIPDEDKTLVTHRHLDVIAGLTQELLQLAYDRPIPAYSNGRRMTFPNPEDPDAPGEPVWDHSPRMAAMDRIAKFLEREAKMLGTDSAEKQEINAVVEHKPTEVLSLIEQAKQRVAEDEAVLREGRQQEEAAAREEHGPA